MGIPSNQRSKMEKLAELISDEEVKKAIFEMGPNNVAMEDRLNAFFF